MQGAVGLFLLALGGLLAVGSFRDRPDVLLAVLLVPTAAIYQQTDGRAEWFHWFLLPIALYVPFAAIGIFKSEESMTPDERHSKVRLSEAREQMKGRTSLGVYIVTGIFIAGFVLIGSQTQGMGLWVSALSTLIWIGVFASLIFLQLRGGVRGDDDGEDPL